MNPPDAPGSDGPADKNTDGSAPVSRKKALALVCAMAVFVLWAQLGSGIHVFRSEVVSEPGWEKFRREYRIGHFGEDGQFVRAVQNGYNLVYHTHKYAPRFTRDATDNRAQSCVACHTAEDLAYGFVNSDR